MLCGSKRHLVLFVLASLSVTALSEFCVEGENGEKMCSSTITLQDIATNVSNSVVISINADEVVLFTPVVFSNLQNITIRGNEESTIRCKDTGNIQFHSVWTLIVENLTITNCSDGCGKQLSAAVCIITCWHVEVASVNISKNPAAGMVIVNTKGNVSITRSTFQSNGGFQEMASAGGLHIQANESQSISNLNETVKEVFESIYSITACSFLHNSAVNRNMNSTSDILGSGGGLSVNLQMNAISNYISIDRCNFTRNTASLRGGGLHISISENASNNVVIIQYSMFYHNLCTQYGGGSALTFNPDDFGKLRNIIDVWNCTFVNNSAWRGGGVFFSSSKVNLFVLTNFIRFGNSWWEYNSAVYGAAINIQPQWKEQFLLRNLPMPEFINCSFRSNHVDCTLTPTLNNMDSCTSGQGALSIFGFTIHFSGRMEFTNNSGSALVLTDTAVHVHSPAEIVFTNNTGSRGAALAMYNSPFIRMMGDPDQAIMFSFKRNMALFDGGAIFSFSTDAQSIGTVGSCFISCGVDKPQINFDFSENKAGATTGPTKMAPGYGDILFANSLQPCLRACNLQNNSTFLQHNTEYFFIECIKCNAVVTLQQPRSNECSYNISTESHSVSADRFISIIPGKETMLGITAYDDLHQKVDVSFRASMLPSSLIDINSNYFFVTSNLIKLHGEPGKKGTLRLEALGALTIVSDIDVTLEECPPGYVLSPGCTEENTQGCSCVCSAVTDEYYMFIRTCNDTLFVAMFPVGQWIGYIAENDSDANPSTLMTSICPFTWCFSNENDTHVPLPPDTSVEALETLVCADNRTGDVCGKCANSLVVLFHSEPFECGKRDKCAVGWLLYIVAELLPLTVIFVIVLFLNINLSSGSLTGLVLFAQVQPMLRFSIANSIIVRTNDVVYSLYRLYNVIYGLFNFTFFEISTLSFCMWESANPLDMLLLKYASTLYALCLVLGLAFALNRCPCSFWQKYFFIWREYGITQSVIQGMVAFLVLCYAQCSTVTLNLLIPIHLRGMGAHSNYTRVYYFPSWPYFGDEHKPYALTAMCFLVFFVAIPPLVLLFYPLCFRVLGYVHLTESRLGTLLSKVFDKIKPFLDVFQSCYKDKYRFIAGLYFLYKVIIPTLYVAISSAQLFFSLSLIFFISAAGFHSIAQPFHERKHNIINSLIFTNLSLITVLYWYNHENKDKVNPNMYKMTLIVCLQLILIYLPLLALIIVVTYKVAFIVLKKLRRNRSNQENDVYYSYDDFPARLLVESENELSQKAKTSKLLTDFVQ